MTVRRILVLAAVAAVLAMPAQAQETEEIVVTGSRIADRFEDYAPPQVSTVRRADFVIQTVEVECDTRDPAQRRSEIVATLEAMERQAGRAGEGVSLAIGEDFVRPFTARMGRDLIRANNRREETESLRLLIRTPVRANDTLETAQQRLKRFVASVRGAGRTEVLLKEEPELTLVNPARVRNELVAAIAADARALSGMLGPGYTARIGGLENQIAWRRTGELELTLFVPYTLELIPAGR
jgi:hypothetical protein